MAGDRGVKGRGTTSCCLLESNEKQVSGCVFHFTWKIARRVRGIVGVVNFLVIITSPSLINYF